MEKCIGVGIRGTGQVAIQHIAAINKNPHTFVKGICGRDVEKAKAFAHTYAPNATVFTHYHDMLDEQEIKIISECMPNYLHASEGLDALRANKHLILEKPAGITQQESDELSSLARSSKVKTVVSFVLRWHPMVQSMKSIIDNNTIGEIYYAQGDYWHGISPTFSSYNWIRQQKFAGGAMITGGSHAVDIMRFLHGEIEEVSAYSVRKREDFDYPTTYVASVKFIDGSIGKVSASLDGTQFPYQFNIDLLGTQGAIRDNKLFSNNSDKWTTFSDETPNSGSVAHHPFSKEIDNLVDAIINDTTTLCPIEDACKTMDVVYAINESAQKGVAVSL